MSEATTRGRGAQTRATNAPSGSEAALISPNTTACSARLSGRREATHDIGAQDTMRSARVLLSLQVTRLTL